MKTTYQITSLQLRLKVLLPLMLSALLLFSSNLYAADGAFPDPVTANDIIVSGNKRSKESFIKKLVIQCAKQGKNTVFIKQCLEGRQLFKNIEISVNDNSKLDVKLEDKITWIVFPIIASGGENEESATGLILADINTGGRGDLTLLKYEHQEPSGRDSYEITYGLLNLGDNLDESSILRLGQVATEYQQFSGTNLIYGTTEESSLFEVSYSRPEDQFIRLDYSLGYSSTKFNENYIITTPGNPKVREDNPDATANEIVTYTKGTLGIGYSLAVGAPKEYYNSGIEFSQKLEGDFYDFSNDDRDEQGSADRDKETPNENDIKLSTSFSLGVPSVRNQAFLLYLKHEIRQQDNAFGSYKIGAQIGSRGIPNSGLWGKEYAVLGMEYQMPVLQRKKFIWTFAPFIDLGNMNGIPNTNSAANLPDNISWSAGGLATYFYFGDVFFPAIGIAFAQNNNFYTEGTVNVLIGRSF
ncbi:MAG: hypothetical protein HAW61_00225 [Candidatus Portiera sp.]|nr:hypothetical protein [Portiera sp.]